jgi:glucose/arabinose dehydrogenase
MMKTALTLLCGLVLSRTLGAQSPPGTPLPIVGPLPATPAEVFIPNPPGIAVETVVTGLEVVWSLQFAPDGRLFLTERPGRVRIVTRDGRLEPRPWATIASTSTGGEGGLMGLALHPDFPREPWVYLMYTARRNGQLINRVTRLREVNGSGTGEEVILDDIPAAINHNGGRLIFGPDRMLYVSVGDAYQPTRVQDLTSPLGKILRLTPTGGIPADNPFPANRAWAYGLRNPNGLAFHPATGTLFAGDHGPSSEWRSPPLRDRDELNLVRRGANHGWPLVVGAPGEPGLVDPLISWIPSSPPGALLFYEGTLLPQLRGDLFYSTLAGQGLIRIRFTDPARPERIASVERWFTDGPRGNTVYGRLRALTTGPDGAIYVGTSNYDGRGQPRSADDDRILRIVPRR